jgi:hypothetical protein
MRKNLRHRLARVARSPVVDLLIAVALFVAACVAIDLWPDKIIADIGIPIAIAIALALRRR